MFDRNVIKVNFSKAAVQYDVNAKLQEEIRKHAARLAANYFHNKSTVLDVGCGTGELYQEKSELGVNWKITGVDISYGMCAVANAKENIVINADAGYLPLKDESFDGIFSSLALQWTEKPEDVIKEMLRVLKPQGIAVITTFARGTLSELEDAFKFVDSTPHISKFIEPSQFLLKIVHIGGIIFAAEEQNHMKNYDDVMSLMRSIKNIGASNKLSNRRRGVMTPAQLKKLEQSYKKENDKISASWNVLTMVIGKP